MILNLIAVFIGGGLGAVLRYLTGVLCTRLIPFGFPFATFFVNFLGSFLLGIIFAIFVHKNGLSPQLNLALGVGFCGGLTTFSTFSFEVFDMLKMGNYFTALLYIVLSLIVGLLGIYLGLKCGEIF